jgi:hypothetical protein
VVSRLITNDAVRRATRTSGLEGARFMGAA